MNIYITYESTFFTEQQIKQLSKYGKLIFLENYFVLNNAKYLQEDEEKDLFNFLFIKKLKFWKRFSNMI